MPLEYFTCFFKNVIYLEEIFLWHFVSPWAVSESIALEMVVNEDRWRSQPPGYCFHFSAVAFASSSEEQQRCSLPTAGSLFSLPGFFLNGNKKSLCAVGALKGSISYKYNVEHSNVEPNEWAWACSFFFLHSSCHYLICSGANSV